MGTTPLTNRKYLFSANNHHGSLRVFAPAILCWILATIAILNPETSTWIFWICIFLATTLSIFLFTLRHKRYQRFKARHTLLKIGSFLLLTLAFASTVLAQVEHGNSLRSEPHLIAAAQAQKTVTVAGRTIGFVKPSGADGNKAQLLVRAERISNDSDSFEALREPIDIVAYFPATEKINFGSSIYLTGTVQKTETTRQQGFQIFAAAIETVPTGDFLEGFGQGLTRIRNLLIERAKSIPGAELVPGFAVGDTSIISEHTNEIMLETSLTHLIAVSGANCALIITAIVWIAGWCGLRRTARLVLAGGALFLFTLLIGPDASVQRAAIMAAVLLVGKLGNRKAQGIHTLGFAIFVMLILNPWQAFSAGFQLSVCASFGILVGASSLAHALSRTRLPKWVATPLAVTLAAQIACAPFLLLLQEGLSLSGIPANLLAAPLAPAGTALGLIAALTLPLIPWIGTACVALASYISRAIIFLAEAFSHMPLGRIYWPDGIFGATLFAALELLALMLWAICTGRILLPNSKFRPERKTLWKREKTLHKAPFAIGIIAVMSAVIVTVFTTVSVLIPAAGGVKPPADWAIASCDIGQGDAFLLRNPKHPKAVVLVDTGDQPQLLKKCLQTYGVNRLSLAVLTHDDKDHIGALSVITGIVQETLIAPNIVEQDLTGNRPLLTQLTKAQIPYRFAAAGERVSVTEEGVRYERETAAPASGEATVLRILQPYPEETYDETNAASIAMRVETAGLSALFLADTGKEEHEQMLRHYDPSMFRVDVLKVAHHGSRNASPDLITASHAKWALFSCGINNRYGHPAQSTLDAVKAAGTAVFRTDLQGTVAVTTNPEKRVWVERSASPEALMRGRKFRSRS